MTYQINEKLIIDGEETVMHNIPDLPEHHPQIKELSFNEMHHDPALVSYSSSLCHRGYQGTWEIVNHRLYLKKIDGLTQMNDCPPLFAEWYSGEICIPRGQNLSEHYPDRYEAWSHELRIVVETGYVQSRQVIDHTKTQAGAYFN